jgi:hypothetical protein
MDDWRKRFLWLRCVQCGSGPFRLSKRTFGADLRGVVCYPCAFQGGHA